MYILAKSKAWRVKRTDPVLQYILSRELGISPVMARLLINRGVCTVEDARVFLKGTLDQLGDPFLLVDMDRAVKRILAAIKSREKILVYGDYDADGITATALMVKVLERLDARVDYYIPHRLSEGYGLHEGAVQWARQAGFHLLITVDCGISAKLQVEEAKAAGGPEIIITDHHQVPEEIPQALAVVNPKRSDCVYPFKELAGVGVALKLAQALLQAAGEDDEAWHDYLDLACLGTVADIVPLNGENRLLVKYGLPKLAATNNPGLKALMQVSGVNAEKIGAKEVGFALVPRLNAAGRMGDPRLAVELLLCRDPVRAGELAGELDRENRERQQVESRVLAEALGMLDAQGVTGDRVVVLASPGWHPGVIGIVASRLVEILYRPVLLVSLDGAQSKGSGRSIPGFHLYRALCHCREHLLGFGGHAGAAGFSILADRVDALRKTINDYAAAVMSTDLLLPGLDVDTLVSLRDISPELVVQLEMLAPHGHGNPMPLLACCGVSVVHCREVGKDSRHLKLLVRENGMVLEGIGFRMVGHLDDLAVGEMLDLAFIPSFDCWNGSVRVQLEIKDLRRSQGAVEPVPRQGNGVQGDDKEPPHGNSGSSYRLEYRSPAVGKLFNEAEKLLIRAGRSLFLPEFVQRKLIEYEQEGDGSLLSAWYCPCGSIINTAGGTISVHSNRECFQIIGREEFSQAACTAERVPAVPERIAGSEELPWRLVDRRGQVGRPSWLAGLADGGHRTLVVVNSPHRTVELAAYLRWVCSGSGKQVAFCHPWLSGEQQALISKLFSSGEVNVLLTTPGLAPALAAAGISQLVVYHLPYDVEEWKLILMAARAGCVQSLYLLFGPDDLRQAQFYLSALAPERDPLAKLYSILHRTSNDTGILYNTGKTDQAKSCGPGTTRKKGTFFYHMTSLLRRAGCPWAEEFTVGLGLIVFKELGLVECLPPENDWPVSLCARGKEKMSLTSSPTYRWLHQLKKQALAWQKYALEAPASLIGHYLAGQMQGIKEC